MPWFLDCFGTFVIFFVYKGLISNSGQKISLKFFPKFIANGPGGINQALTSVQ